MPPKINSGPTPRIATIAPTQDLRVVVTWRAGPRSGKKEELDLSPILNSMKFFRPLRNDPALFATIHPIDYGTAVAWGEDEEIDLSAGAILRLAEETMRPEDMRAFITAHDLTETSLAAILDYSRRQIVGFINEGRPIPRVVSLACRYVELANTRPRPEVQHTVSQPSISLPHGFTVRGSTSVSASIATAADLASVSITGTSVWITGSTSAGTSVTITGGTSVRITGTAGFTGTSHLASITAPPQTATDDARHLNAA